MTHVPLPLVSSKSINPTMKGRMDGAGKMVGILGSRIELVGYSVRRYVIGAYVFIPIIGLFVKIVIVSCSTVGQTLVL